jgi:X-X-X-Leu-X-X-Gly heptad repeat protein
VAFTIQYDPRSSGFPTSRYALAKDKLKLTKRARKQDRLGLLPIPDFLVDTLPGENSADPRALTSFVKWSSRKFPSKWRMLILSGHGSGAMGDFLPDDDARTGQPDSLTIPRLANALKKAKADIAKWNEGRALLKSGGESRLVHVLGMDSCLMGMAEVGHQVKEEVEFLVGSEGFVPNAGWPYARLLMALSKKTGRPPEKMARDTVKDVVGYYHQYVPAGVSFDMSACSLEELPKVAKAVKRLVAKLNARMGNAHFRDIVIAAHWHCQSYKFEQHSDLWDFCDQLAKGLRRSLLSGRKGIVTACQKVKAAVAAAIQNRKGYCGAEFQHSHGLSVYFPWSRSPFEEKALAHYVRLTFPRATGSNWSSFLATYVRRTRRPEQRKRSRNSLFVSRFLRQSPYGPGKAAEGTNRAAEGTNRAAEGTNRAAEGTNRLIMKLFSGPGATLPGSMKNPPNGVWVRPRKREV